MNHYVADTRALFWYLTNSPLLGAKASAAFDEADNDQAIIYLPSIVAAELYFLNKKLSGAIDFNKEMTALFQVGQFVLCPLRRGMLSILTLTLRWVRCTTGSLLALPAASTRHC